MNPVQRFLSIGPVSVISQNHFFCTKDVSRILSWLLALDPNTPNHLGKRGTGPLGKSPWDVKEKETGSSHMEG